MKDRLLRPTEVAERLAVSDRTIYRLLESGELRGLRIRGAVRVLPASVDEYLRRKISEYQLEIGFFAYDDLEG